MTLQPPDFLVENLVTLAVLTPKTPKAKRWLAAQIPPEIHVFADGVVMDTALLQLLLDDVREVGFTVASARSLFD